MTPPQNLDEYSQFDMVGMLEGEFRSYFSNRAVPDGVETSYQGPTREEFEAQGFDVEDDSDEEPDDGGGPSEDGGDTGGGMQDEGVVRPVFVRAKSPKTQIVVIGNTRWLAEGAPQRWPGNLGAFWAILDRMTTGSSLTDIRNRSIAPPAVRADLTPGTKSAVRYAGMLGVPILVLVLGVGAVFLRRSRRAAA